jgi:hypothetical protein
MVIIVMAVAATAGTLGIGTTTITAYGQTSQQQPPITSNDECLPGSVVHCIDDLRDLDTTIRKISDFGAKIIDEASHALVKALVDVYSL